MNENNESLPERRVKLHVMGISYNQIHNDVYALILAQDNGPYRLPVVIGTTEAQSIAAYMQGISTPRPMTHDLFVSFSHAFGVCLKYVYIYKFESGIFSSELSFTDGDREILLDARTSDAVAIAVRTGAPIYTTPEILKEVGFIMKDDTLTHAEGGEDDPNADEGFLTDDNSDMTIADENQRRFSPKPENLAVEELEKLLENLINDENYEEAAKISEIIRKKRESSN